MSTRDSHANRPPAPAPREGRKSPGDPPGDTPGDTSGDAGDETRASRPKEIGGPTGPEPTRYGDWERGGRCSDF
ncbi:MAG: DUF1674 domain-containing protein [Gammaproteobacteria bacterium]|nr:DUF1674 domain-containing protein [Gammaproteobacteria bacterium]